MKRILVRADDLGYSEAVNYGIQKTVTDGIVRSVGVMTNMPYTKHGLDLLKNSSVCLGLHTNICVGRPLADPAQIPSLLREDGTFHFSREFRTAEKDFVDLEEVIIEVEAQYQMFVKLTGRKPAYFEGHAVKSENFFKGLEIVAERNKCDYLAFSPAAPVKFRNTMLYPGMQAEMPQPGKLPDPQKAFIENVLNNKDNDHIEMHVCHPGYIDAYLLETSSLTIPRPMEVKMLCSAEVKELLDNNNIKVVSYEELD